MTKQSRRLILILTLGVFGILNTEMGIVGILPMIAQRFDVSIASAGWLVSGFALVVAAAGPTMPLLCSRMDRKTLMLTAGGDIHHQQYPLRFCAQFCSADACAHPAGGFSSGLRFHGAHRGRAAVPSAESAKAVSKVFIGVSAGMVLGVPVTNLIAANTSFTAAMLFFAAVNAAVLVLTLLFVPAMPAAEALSYGQQLGVLRKPAMLLAVSIVLFLNGAIFGFYSYFSDFLGRVTVLEAGAVSLLLMLYGAANIVGNMIAGRLLTVDVRRTAFLLPFVLLAAYGLLFLTGGQLTAAALASVLIGALAGINTNVNQYLVTEAGAEAPEFANGLYLTSPIWAPPSVPFICGLFITAMGTRYALCGTFIFIAAGFAATALKLAQDKPSVLGGEIKEVKIYG